MLKPITQNDIEEWGYNGYIINVQEWNEFKEGIDYHLGGKVTNIFVHHESNSAWIVVEENGKLYTEDIKYGMA